ncbi:putative facilitator of salicylate uptake [hydrothermal vent metagenome]|uniref:Putative facilitator of salicylate uptake n=1 Tax=hydrothermal vent metagenome TaxID=652676 RepID=A0A3B0XXE0_9ZZZZ
MSRGIKQSLIALSVSGALFAPSAFATNGYFAHGYSTAEKGLAGAGVAHSQDAMAIANNPAGIAGMGSRMDVGAALFSPMRSYTVTGAPSQQCQNPGPPEQGCTFSLEEGKQDSNMDLFLIPHFAYNWKLDSNSSTALALYGNGGMNTNYKTGSATLNRSDGNGFVTEPGTFGDGTTGVDLKQLFVNLSYATKLSKNHSFGAGIIFAYQLFEAKGLANFGGNSSNPSKLSGNGADSSTGFGAKLGWQGKVMSGLVLGASYQSKISMSEFDDYAGLFAEGGGFDIPSTASLGLAWDTSDKSTLVFEVQSIYYSDVASISNSISGLTNGTCQPGPTGGTGPGCLGGSAGAGFGWDDMTIYKLGYEWGDTTLWRVGISQGSQPIPKSETMFNILAPAVMETHITAGFTLPLGADSEFALAAMYAPKQSVSGVSAFDPGQTIEIEMVQYELQATYSMKF